MNPLSKTFCRAFQFCFRTAIPILPYRKPQILSSIDEIPRTMQDRNLTSALLVTDAGIRKCGLTQNLEDQLAIAGIKCTVFDGTKPNPSVFNVEDALALYHENNCDCIIALGGGSPMDCAKAVGARVVYPHKTVGQLKGLLRVLRSLPPLFAIPTTAGTGSEVTITAVITDSEHKDKYTMNSFTLIPHYAVLDPHITVSLPPHLTSTTGMDALTHAVEAYIGNSTTKETRALSLDAVHLIFKNITDAYHDGTNIPARKAMLEASHMAGLAFEKSYVGYVHAIAHSLGGEYDIPHGYANAIILPHVLEAYGSVIDSKLKDLAIAAGICTKQTPADKAAREFINAINELNAEMGIPRYVSGIQREDIPRLAQHAAKEANPLYPVPVLWNAQELQTLYVRISDWGNACK